MDGSQPAKKLLSAGCNSRVNLTTIGFSMLALDVAAIAQAIDQFNGRMVTELHSLRQHTNGRLNLRRKPLDGEQQLMLLSVQAIFPGSLFTESEKSADLIAELCERAVILRIHP